MPIHGDYAMSIVPSVRDLADIDHDHAAIDHNLVDQLLAVERTCSQNPWSRDGIVDQLFNRDSIFLIIRSPDKTLAAFACALLVLDELQILEAAVLPNHRRKGLGVTLIKELLSQAVARNAARATLEVRVSNAPAINLYEKTGFKRDTVRKNYYQDGEDAVLMSRTICADIATPHANLSNSTSG